jgi:hypothetical protein
MKEDVSQPLTTAFTALASISQQKRRGFRRAPLLIANC